MKKTDIAREYVQRFQGTPNLTLAKKMCKDYPEVFTVEGARAAIRYVRGSLGDRLRKFATKDLKQNRDDMKNPFNMPDSQAKEWTKYKIPKKVENTLLLSDIHLPYHDLPALTAALEYGQREEVDSIILNGDLLDFYALSRFEKDPRKRSFSGELDDARQFFESLRKHFPNAHIYYKIGNHEERWERYLYVKAPELLDVEDFKLNVLLRLAEYGIHYIDDKRIIDYGGLLILHGHEFFGSPSQAVNPARGLWMKAYASSLLGHLHKTSEHAETDLKGKLHTTWSVGCLCELNPEYARINKWNHGFAHLRQDKGFNVKNVRIYKGEIL